MIRIDHITDPYRFLRSMAIARVMAAQPSFLPALIVRVPALVARILDWDAEARSPRAGRPPRPATPHPSAA